MPPFQPPAGRSGAFSALINRGRALLSWLWAQEGSHGQRARGLAAGIFCGCFPFFGLQTLLGIALASLLRGNHLLAAAGTWISNPFTYVPLYWFNYQLGCWLLGPGTAWPGLTALQAEGLGQLGWSVASRLLLGSTLVGLVCAVAGGWLYWVWLERAKAGTADPTS
jgi:uncharacterized protein (DUF2062 family)